MRNSPVKSLTYAHSPILKCPRCRAAAEYQSTIEMLDPPVGKMNRILRRMHLPLRAHPRDRLAAYESTSWPPVCRTCRAPFAAVRPESDRALPVPRSQRRRGTGIGHDKWTRVGCSILDCPARYRHAA